MGKQKKAKQTNSDEKRSFAENIKAKMPVLKFFGIFAGVIALYYLFVAFADFGFMDFYVNASANLSGAVLGLFGEEITVAGGIIMSPKVAVALSFGCEGSEPIVIFIAGVLAFPSVLRKKLYGLAMGVAGLYLLNLIRIIGLYYILESSGDMFELFHAVVFPILFIIIAVVAWGLWIKWTLPKKLES